MSGFQGGWRVRAALTLAALMVAGCSQQPQYVRPDQPLPANFAHDAGREELRQPPSQWWREFGSDELTDLVETALRENHDLKAAFHRITQAESLAGVAAGTLLPTLQYSTKASVTSPKGGIGTMDATERSERLYQVGLQASYEVDLWGKNRSAMDAALATAQASLYDRETVAITLVSDVVVAYLNYLQATDRIAVANSNIDNMRRVLVTVTKRAEIGEGTELEQTQQQNALEQALATLPVLELFRSQQANRLALLTGRTPQEVRLHGTSLEQLRIPEVAPGLPSQLLLRRPDVRKAEAGLVAANANVGVARAKLFPSLTLTGERGYGAPYLSQMLTPAGAFYTAAAALGGVLFNNGQTQSEIDYSKARFAELVESYRHSILSSLRDVEDALVAVRFTTDQERAQRSALAVARRAHNLSQRAYAVGMTDYLTVLDTERTQHTAEDNTVQARFSRLNAAVSLYKALGGGTEQSVVEEQG
jgi:NodT family efflux transporter outer membrane factor (OMF) lipoprotein